MTEENPNKFKTENTPKESNIGEKKDSNKENVVKKEENNNNNNNQKEEPKKNKKKGDNLLLTFLLCVLFLALLFHFRKPVSRFFYKKMKKYDDIKLEFEEPSFEKKEKFKNDIDKSDINENDINENDIDNKREDEVDNYEEDNYNYEKSKKKVKSYDSDENYDDYQDDRYMNNNRRYYNNNDHHQERYPKNDKKVVFYEQKPSSSSSPGGNFIIGILGLIYSLLKAIIFLIRDVILFFLEPIFMAAFAIFILFMVFIFLLKKYCKATIFHKKILLALFKSLNPEGDNEGKGKFSKLKKFAFYFVARCIFLSDEELEKIAKESQEEKGNQSLVAQAKETVIDLGKNFFN